MKYIKNQFAKVVFLFLVISLIVTGMLKLADHDFIYSLSILFGCSSPAPLTLKICFFMFVILAQYFNADGFIFYIKNIDYLLRIIDNSLLFHFSCYRRNQIGKPVKHGFSIYSFCWRCSCFVFLYRFFKWFIFNGFYSDTHKRIFPLCNSGIFSSNAAHPRWRDKMLWSNSVACSRLYFFETVVFTIGFICIFI